MIVLLDTSESLSICASELGCRVEQLLTPLTYRLPQQIEQHYAIDNGCFANFEEGAFLRLLERERKRRDLCRFVSVPDVVGSALRTLEVFQEWKQRLSDWPLAFVCQDGQENLPIPWKEIQSIFIGGSTEWKISKHSENCIKAAKIIGKWVHVGRVNTPGRFEHFEKLGADSIDGTGLSQYSWMRYRIYNDRNTPKFDFMNDKEKNSPQFTERLNEKQENQ